MSGVKIKHRKSLVERAKGVWDRYKEVKHGIFGLVVIIAFFVMAAIAPLLFPLYPGQLVRVGPDYAAPLWMSWTDPQSPPTGVYNPDPVFDSSIDGWTFIPSNPSVASMSYDTSEGNFIQGTRAAKLTLNDASNTEDYDGEFIAGVTTFDWAYHEPALCEIVFFAKSQFTGNLSQNSVEPYVEIKLPPGVILPRQYYHFTLSPTYPADWDDFKRSVNALIMFEVFQPGELVTIEIGVEFTGNTTSMVGTAEFWFDSVAVICYSDFWGAMGTTDAGQDVLAQLFWGAQVSLYIGIIATFIGVLVGLLLGLVAGYFGGTVDEIVMRVVDFFIIMPSLPIMMILAALLRPSLEVTLMVIALFAWPGPARVIRSQVLVEREKAYVEAAKAAGAGDLYLIFRHVFPNVLTLVFVQVATGVSGAILSEAGLSFLGLTPQNLVSWGRMLSNAYNEAAMAIGAWWYVVPPGLFIALLSMGFVFVGYAVDKALNPRLRRL
jgi:peptide/nickel transport system permease protein